MLKYCAITLIRILSGSYMCWWMQEIRSSFSGAPLSILTFSLAEASRISPKSDSTWKIRWENWQRRACSCIHWCFQLFSSGWFYTVRWKSASFPSTADSAWFPAEKYSPADQVTGVYSTEKNCRLIWWSRTLSAFWFQNSVHHQVKWEISHLFYMGSRFCWCNGFRNLWKYRSAHNKYGCALEAER